VKLEPLVGLYSQPFESKTLFVLKVSKKIAAPVSPRPEGSRRRLALLFSSVVFRAYVGEDRLQPARRARSLSGGVLCLSRVPVSTDLECRAVVVQRAYLGGAHRSIRARASSLAQHGGMGQALSLQQPCDCGERKSEQPPPEAPHAEKDDEVRHAQLPRERVLY